MQENNMIVTIVIAILIFFIIVISGSLTYNYITKKLDIEKQKIELEMMKYKEHKGVDSDTGR